MQSQKDSSKEFYRICFAFYYKIPSMYYFLCMLIRHIHLVARSLFLLYQAEKRKIVHKTYIIDTIFPLFISRFSCFTRISFSLGSVVSKQIVINQWLSTCAGHLQNFICRASAASPDILPIYFTTIYVEPVPIYCRYNSQMYMQSQSRYIAVIFQDVKNLQKQVGQSKRPTDYDDKSKNIDWQRNLSST